jgi:hypothetical protein
MIPFSKPAALFSQEYRRSPSDILPKKWIEDPRPYFSTRKGIDFPPRILPP